MSIIPQDCSNSWGWSYVYTNWSFICGRTEAQNLTRNSEISTSHANTFPPRTLTHPGWSISGLTLQINLQNTEQSVSAATLHRCRRKKWVVAAACSICTPPETGPAIFQMSSRERTYSKHSFVLGVLLDQMDKVGSGAFPQSAAECSFVVSCCWNLGAFVVVFTRTCRRQGDLD